MNYKEFISITKNLKPSIFHKDYLKYALLFQELVMQDVEHILNKHKRTLYISINEVELAKKDSAINSSTAYGYIVEEFIVRQLPYYYKKPLENTNNSPFDFQLISDGKIHLYVNLKVEKDTNNAVCAAGKLIDLYKSYKHPILYLILKLPYDIDESHSSLLINKPVSIYLESFITTYVKADSRNWTSKEYKPLSGRLQTPNNNNFDKYTYDKIPPFNEVKDAINKIEYLLMEGKA